MDEGYINGHIERKAGGLYQGTISISGINLGAITAQYFKRDNDTYLWLKRKRILEYNDKTLSYTERDAQPRWEAYLKKQVNDSTVAYKGEFMFMRFKFSIVGIWDRILGTDSQQRMNLYVERLPMNEQTIVNNINERKRNEQKQPKER